MWTDLPAPVTEALERLNAQGCQGFLVGGCVRDLLRGVPPTDYDMTTSAKPREVMALFADKTVVETGIKHGTVTVFSHG
ncbi:MAG: tRNA nucleotidyltransferase, partial [Clostridia bacterium]|nr:tRNA nucleotidyltransferase [Clostridia bacterium]